MEKPPMILVPKEKEYNLVEEVHRDYILGLDFLVEDTDSIVSCRDFVGERVQIKYKPGMYVEIKH